MKHVSETNPNANSASSSSHVSMLSAEVEALRKRLADLEQNLPAYRSRHLRAWKSNSRTMIVGVVLMTLAVVLIVWKGPSVVQSQSGVTDPLTIDKNGNVGIRTTTPGTALDVNGEIRARTASILESVNATSLKFPDGTTQSTAAPPAGAVIAFNRSACPSGWSEYAPARGRFIRGIDKSGQNIDPSGQRAPGNTQEDAIRNITGSITGVKGAGNRAWDWGFRPGTNGVFDVPYNLSKYNPYGGGEYLPDGGVGWSANFDASRVVPTAAENRPKNVALLYCEKN